MMALVPAFVMLAGCDGKTESAATPSVDSASVVPAAVDSAAAAAADTLAKLVGDSATKKAMSTPVPAKVETGDYDKAIRPKFKIDEKTGKIDTIKKP
ncbi:MAG: hypothetical protein Q8K82_17280 [Gemmatimonadaceae bacterium]|nr:hypothetical protein [Gemmatimonadaceae bacterium]